MSNTKKRILLVEDEVNFGSLLQNYLRLSKYDVDWKEDGSQGYSAFRTGDYDLCILDVMMPHLDGFSLAEKIREKDHDVPIIFLTAKNMKEDQLKGYKVGADDYLTKPFDIEVLLMKLEVLFRRSEGKAVQQKSVYTIGNYKFTPQTRELAHPKDKRKLSPKEGELLLLLCEHLNEIMPREKALKKIWKEESYFTTRSMDVYITKLRKYLGADGKVRIENLHKSGYSLMVEG